MAQRYTGRRRAYRSFTAQVEDIVQVNEKRMLALMRQSVQDVIENAQTPVAKGGRMRVDLGFLRGSGKLSLTGMPTGPSRPEKKDAPKGSLDTFDMNTVIAELGKVQLGNTIFFGWTANYAKYRELFDGFLEGALQHWHRIVAFNTDTIRKRVSK